MAKTEKGVLARGSRRKREQTGPDDPPLTDAAPAEGGLPAAADADRTPVDAVPEVRPEDLPDSESLT